MKRLLGLVLLAFVIPAPQAKPEQVQPPTADDAQILQVALDEVVRKEAVRLEAANPSTLLVVDHTLPLCSANSPDRSTVGCVSEEPEYSPLAQLATVFAKELPEPDRTDIRSSFLERNRASVALSARTLDNVTLVSSADIRARYSEQTGRGAPHATVTLPGVSRGGRAVVYVTYWCGNLCAYGWFVLVEKTPAGWKRIAVHLLWIS